jgi:hypothetical protein
MEIRKINLDRKPIDSEYIRSRQDFQQIIKSYKKTVNPVWKQPLFYGVVGFASFAAAVTFSLIDLKPVHEDITTHSRIESQILQVDLEEIAGHQEVRKTPNTADLNIVHAMNSSKDKSEANGDSEPMIEESNAASENILLSEFEPKRSGKVGMPSIGGYYDGTLSLSSLCGKEGIKVNGDAEVSSFRIQYYAEFNDQVVQVKGNQIPEEVCTGIEKSGGDQLIFITEIIAESLNGNVKLPSMSFWINV